MKNASAEPDLKAFLTSLSSIKSPVWKQAAGRSIRLYCSVRGGTSVGNPSDPDPWFDRRDPVMTKTSVVTVMRRTPT